MENSQTLATDSFSYSWLINRKPTSIDNINGFLVESHHRPSLLKKEEEEDFDFNVNCGDADRNLIPADEIFSGGCIKPLYHNSSPISSSTPISASTSFSPPPRINITNANNRMRKWSKSPLFKCFEFLSRRFGHWWCSRKSVRVIDFLDRNDICEVGIISSSGRDSSLLVFHSVPNSPAAGSRDVEITSIHEAILHCKRSFGM